MTQYLNQYIERLHCEGIAVLSSEWHEERSGYQNEHTVEEIVCRIGGVPHQLTVHWLQKFGWGAGLDYHLLDRREITEDDYLRLCSTHRVLDSPEYHEKLRRARATRRQIDELKPTCPKCQSMMTHRSSQYGDFWGCPNYPRCKGTRQWDKQLESSIRELEQDLDS